MTTDGTGAAGGNRTSSGRPTGREGGVGGRRRLRRLLLWGGGGLLLLVLVLLAAAPTIASSLAPGMIEGSVNPGIKGRITVAKASMGWFSPLRAGPVEVTDPEGNKTATFTAGAPLTVWKALTGRVWSARSLDLGVIDVSGRLDVRQYNDGTTSLDRALAPRDGAAPPARPPAAEPASSRPLPSVKATLRVSQFEAIVRNESDGFRSELGLKGFKGEARIDADPGASGGGLYRINADFSGSAVAPGGADAAAAVTLKVDADVKQTSGPSPGLDRAKVKLALTNAPVGIADALASLGGALVQGVGERADVTADIDGNLQALDADVRIVSAGLNADAHLAIKDGQLTAAPDKPTTVKLASTEFLDKLPQTREPVRKAAEQLRLTQAPSIEISLDRLRVPVGNVGGAGGAGGAGFDLKTLDLRGASLAVSVKVSGVTGQVLLGGGGAAPAGASGSWKPFSVEPISLAIDLTDLSKPVSITTGTKATLDGQPAGDLNLSINADGLLNEHGRLRALQGAGAGFANRAEASVKVVGVSTSLLAPIAAGALKSIPLDLGQDVGPTLDLDLVAKADVAGVTNAGAVGGGAGGGAAGGPSSLESLPPTDLRADISSRNLKAQIDARLDKGVLTTRADGSGAGAGGLRLTIDSAAPLAQRILAAPRAADPAAAPGAAANPLSLGGRGRIDLAGRDLSLPLSDTRPEAILSKGRGIIELVITDLSAAMDMGGSKSPVEIQRHTTILTLTPGQGPKVDLDGALAHEGQPFTIKGGYVLEGLRQGVPATSGPGALAAFKPVGTVDVKGLPRSLLGIVPATAGYASASAVAPDATDLTRAIAGLVRDVFGPAADVSLRLLGAPADKGGGHYANVKLETTATGSPAGVAAADVWLRVSATDAEISNLTARLPLDGRWVNPVLAAAAPPKAAEAGAPVPPPMTLGAPTKLHLYLEKPATVPFKPAGAGTAAAASPAPDWPRAGEVQLKASVEGDLIIENVAVGGGGGGAKRADGTFENPRLTKIGLGEINALVKAPLAGVPSEARAANRASIRLTTTARDRTSGSVALAKLAVDATAAMDGSSPDGAIDLTEIATGPVENVMGRKDLLVGALGDSASVSLRVKPAAAPAAGQTNVLNLTAEITSERISGARLVGGKSDEYFWLEPSKITWRPNEKFINRYVLGGGDPGDGGGRPRPQGAGAAEPAALSLEKAQPITIDISRLAVAMPQSDAAGAPVRGPLKPGIFELDLGLTAPSMNVDIAPGQPGQAATKLTIEGLRMTARAPRATGGAAAPIELDLGIDRVGGTPQAPGDAGKRSTARIRVSNAADSRGVITADRAAVDADVDIASFPTPIIDNLANQKGVLSELLGPTVSLLAKARNVSRGGGQAGAGDLDVDAVSPRATAKIKGDVRNGQFVQSGPLSIQIREIRNQLIQALAGSVPLVQTLEKTPPDEPAVISTEGFTVPLDGDMRKLNGKVQVSLGIARFTTEGFFGQFIKGLGGRESGTLGKRIQPFVVNIDKGVATYDRFALPVGEFSIETRGTIDLVQRRMDVVTYAPIGALTDEALGRLSTGIGGKLTEGLQVPFTTRGSMDNPERVYPDVGLFIKEAGDRIIKDPGKIIGDVIGDLLKPKDPQKK